VAFATFHLLVAIKAAHPTALCCLHRLAIHDNHRWTRISDAGFFRYLTKPIKVKEFMDTLNAALEFAEEERVRD
jgi:DNA-binding NtrC family response regulator